MRLVSSGAIASLLVFTALAPATAAPRLHRGPTSPRSIHSVRSKAAPKPAVVHAIAPERVTQIQSALIARGYLSGSPTGAWDAETQSAMMKLQAENGWQTKLIPDSRAIIKLGLGPGSTASAAEAAEPIPSAEPLPAPVSQ